MQLTVVSLKLNEYKDSSFRHNVVADEIWSAGPHADTRSYNLFIHIDLNIDISFVMNGYFITIDSKKKNCVISNSAFYTFHNAFIQL